MSPASVCVAEKKYVFPTFIESDLFASFLSGRMTRPLEIAKAITPCLTPPHTKQWTKRETASPMSAAQHSHCNIWTRRGIRFGTVGMEFVDAATIINSRRSNTTPAAAAELKKSRRRRAHPPHGARRIIQLTRCDAWSVSVRGGFGCVFSHLSFIRILIAPSRGYQASWLLNNNHYGTPLSNRRTRL